MVTFYLLVVMWSVSIKDHLSMATKFLWSLKLTLYSGLTQHLISAALSKGKYCGLVLVFKVQNSFARGGKTHEIFDFPCRKPCQLQPDALDYLFRSGCPEVFCKKGVLRNFAKFTGKHLCQSLFFNTAASSYTFCQTFSYRTPSVAASVY